MGRPAAAGNKEGPPGDGAGGQWSEGDPSGQSQDRGGGPLAEPGAASTAKEEEEEPGPERGGRYPGAGKDQRQLQGVPAEQGHPAVPLGQEGSAGRANKEDDGATGVAKPEVAAGEATHPAPAGAEGEGGRGGAMDAMSMGVASPDGEAEAGEANLRSL
ncbi:uncharacterized protein Dana_GF27144 [Drosophila ananassae]|uniref:Uncharacterized protein n=1 Tax=Drosophila ananassae TaxID=7217 RepID=A0A0P8XZK1_DROAN|nr:uncharacterized protein Dana_GF27144 [Drosophila ananassae]